MNVCNSFEIELLHDLKNLIRCDFLDWFMPKITLLGNYGIFWIVFAAVLLCFSKTRKIGLTMAIAFIFGLITGNILLKPLIGRVRPYDFDPSIFLLIPPEHDFSFPSGHTMVSFEGAVSIFLYHKNLGTAALLLASAIAFSRLYLMVHYPLDIIAGIILGSGLALTAYKLTKKIPNKI